MPATAPAGSAVLALDHLAVTARSLEEGCEAVEAALGVALSAGGRHDAMGTHNALLRLGADVYLEVIAVDPAAPEPPRPRWFDMDRFEGPPRLTNWIVRTDDLDAALDEAPEGTGAPTDLRRGDLAWRMGVPETGRLPWDGASPALIAWLGDAHPASRLPDRGCRLTELRVEHPDIDGLRAAWPALASLPGIRLERGARKSLAAEIETPSGRVILT